MNSPKVRSDEILAVIGTGLFHLLSCYWKIRGIFIVGAIIGWGLFITYSYRKNPQVLHDWGFRRDNFKASFQTTTLICLPLVFLMGLFALLKGNLLFPLSMIFLLVLYPLWGVTQQFLIQALIIKNLSRSSLFAKKILLILIGASLFSLVHIPEWRLMIGTFGLGIIFVPLYLKYGNLWPLGFYHGFLGSLFYLWVLDQDPCKQILIQIR